MDSFFSHTVTTPWRSSAEDVPIHKARTWPQFHKHRVAHNHTHTQTNEVASFCAACCCFFYFNQNPSLFSCFSHSTFFIFFAFLDFFFGKMRQSRKNKHKSHPNSQKITAKRANRTATAGGDRKRTGRWPTGAGSDPGNHVF